MVREKGSALDIEFVLSLSHRMNKPSNEFDV